MMIRERNNVLAMFSDLIRKEHTVLGSDLDDRRVSFKVLCSSLSVIKYVMASSETNIMYVYSMLSTWFITYKYL